MAHETEAKDAPAFSRISPTAMLLAYFRTYTDIPFAAELAAATDAESVALSLLEGSGVRLEDSRLNAPFAEARYKCIVSALRARGLEQVLELGSGLSFRSLTMAHDPHVIYVETDLPGITEEKLEVLARAPAMRALAERGNVFFRSANAVSSPDIEAALGHFDASRPIGVVNEGLLGYLSFPEKEQVAQNVRRALERHGGVWITPDFQTLAAKERYERSVAGAKEGHAAIAKATDRNFADTVFDDDAHIVSFFERLGFCAEPHPQLDGTFEVTSLARLDLPATFLDGFDLRVWTLTLRPDLVGADIVDGERGSR